MNYKQLYAKKHKAEKQIVDAFGDPTECSGVYVFHRYNNERETHCFYIGQAKNLRRRIADHLLEHDHIALSLKTYGLYDSASNPNGWSCSWKSVPINMLDQVEQETIAEHMSYDGIELYNITGGGQGKGKTDINKRAERGGWRKGKSAGEIKAWQYIAEQIYKYTTGLQSKGGAIADRKTNELNSKLEEMRK